MNTNRIQNLLLAKEKLDKAKTEFECAKIDMIDLNRSMLKDKNYSQRGLGDILKKEHGIPATNVYCCCNPKHDKKARPSMEMILKINDVIKSLNPRKSPKRRVGRKKRPITLLLDIAINNAGIMKSQVTSYVVKDTYGIEGRYIPRSRKLNLTLSVLNDEIETIEKIWINGLNELIIETE